MINLTEIVVTGLMLAVKFLVPAVVWVTLTAGLLQLVYGGVRRLEGALHRPHKTHHRWDLQLGHPRG